MKLGLPESFQAFLGTKCSTANIQQMWLGSGVLGFELRDEGFGFDPYAPSPKWYQPKLRSRRADGESCADSVAQLGRRVGPCSLLFGAL